MKVLPLFLLFPALVLAQPTFPTAFPTDATSLSPESLRQRLAGKTFLMKPMVGDALRIQYQETFVFINVGSASDSGNWRVEGSSVCIEWKKFNSNCSEMRMVGETLYVKRANNGEVVEMKVK